MGKKSSAGTVAIVMLSILVASFWTVVLYSEWTRDTGSYYIPIADHNVTKVEVVTRASNMGIEIGVLSASSANIFEGDWEHIYSQLGQSEMIVESLTFTNETIGDTLKIYIDSTSNDALNHMGFSMWNVTLKLNPSYITNLTIETDAGSVNIALSDIKLSDLNVETNAGSCEIALLNLELSSGLDVSTDAGSTDISLNNVTIGNNMSIETNAGSLNLAMKNIKLTQKIELQTIADVGSNDITWIQESTLGAPLDISSNTNAGSYDMAINGSLSYLRYDVSQSTNSGSNNFVGGIQFTGTEGEYKSVNIADASKDLVTIKSTTNAGSNSITITA